MPHRFAALLLLACAVLSSCARDEQTPARSHGHDIALVPDTATVVDRVPQRATLATLFRTLELRADLIPAILEKTRAVFDPRRLRAGHMFQMVRTTDGLLREFQYEIDLDSFLHLAASPGEEATTLKAEILPYKKTRTPLLVQGEISQESPSLFAAMEGAGQAIDLSFALADVFGGELDFNTELQPGDTFRVVVDRVLREGEPVGYSPIEAAEFVNSGKRLRAVLFTPPGGKPGYYDEQGRSVRRFFLASPLKFTPHVTSGFSLARFHPILKIYRAHLGVDYAAPQGAPVIAVANGVVLSAGWGGEGGRVIHLRHASGYETYYMHLSAILVRTGEHVSQGQLIGRVGMTGMATGPHLDYRIRKAGTFLNPEHVRRSLPPGEPIPASSMAAFAAERDALLARLDAQPTPAPSPAVPAGSTTPGTRSQPASAAPAPGGRR